MTAEMVAYYRAMMLVGLGEDFYPAFDQTLEEEEPLSDLMLSLCDCISDEKEVIRVLQEYSFAHPFDLQVVRQLIEADMKNRFFTGQLSGGDLVKVLYEIAYVLDVHMDPSWEWFTTMSYARELFEEGIINEEVFNMSFDAWLYGGKSIDVWEAQRKWNKDHQGTNETGFLKKIWNIIKNT